MRRNSANHLSSSDRLLLQGYVFGFSVRPRANLLQLKSSQQIWNAHSKWQVHIVTEYSRMPIIKGAVLSTKFILTIRQKPKPEIDCS